MITWARERFARGSRRPTGRVTRALALPATL
jgi:hypothetical protein